MCVGHYREYILVYTRSTKHKCKPNKISREYSVDLETDHQNADRISQADRSLQCRALHRSWLSGNHKIVGICDLYTNDDL